MITFIYKIEWRNLFPVCFTQWINFSVSTNASLYSKSGPTMAAKMTRNISCYKMIQLLAICVSFLCVFHSMNSFHFFKSNLCHNFLRK